MKEWQNFGKVGFIKKESFNHKFNEKRIKYINALQYLCIYLKPITDIEKFHVNKSADNHSSSYFQYFEKLYELF